MSCVLFTQFPTTYHITMMQYHIQDTDFYKAHRAVLMPLLTCTDVCARVWFCAVYHLHAFA